MSSATNPGGDSHTQIKNIVAPTVNEAANALFTSEEKAKLRSNLIEEQIRQAKYLREHPEIDHLLQIAIGKLVKDQPEDPVQYLTSFFSDNDLEALEAEHTAEEQRMHAEEAEKHAQLADPAVFSLPWDVCIFRLLHIYIYTNIETALLEKKMQTENIIMIIMRLYIIKGIVKWSFNLLARLFFCRYY